MKTIQILRQIIFAALVLCQILISNQLVQAQDRTSQQAVVPRGWESHDSVRFGVFLIDAVKAYVASSTQNQVDSLSDDLQANFQHEFGAIPASQAYSGKRRGYMAYAEYDPSGVFPDFSHLAYVTKQRIYYPSPERLHFRFDNGYYWRYIDTNGYSWHHNSYDSNDVSPYAEFNKNSSIVSQDITTRISGSPTTVKYGNEGRVILGYSDNRKADKLLAVHNRYYAFPSGHWLSDTVRAFSTNLEFNIDTSDIDTSSSLGILKDNLPLLRFQVLFKKAGQNVLPFVPFKTISDSSKSGWWVLVDTLVTKNIYDGLYDDWRIEDTLANGTQARNWKLKQLHIIIPKVSASYYNLIRNAHLNTGSGQLDLKGDYGSGSDSGRINTILHPDSLVNYGTGAGDVNSEYLEFRVLSTYRAKIRVRSMTWQDTIVDKYLYRRHFGDSTHSCNPDGQYGGYDDSVKKAMDQWADALGTRIPREFLINDTPEEFSGLSMPIIGYLDYMGSKRNIYTHLREQEVSNYSLSSHLRRDRLSYDGVPQSIFENQLSDFYTEIAKRFYINFGDVMPPDYCYYARTFNKAVPWTQSALDTMMGIIFARTETPAIANGFDSLRGYKRYTDLYGGLQTITSGIRSSVRIAQNHPKKRRSAVEAAPQGWAILNMYDHTSPLTLNPHYNQRPTTPEETQGQIYAMLANGVTAFNHAQTFDIGDSTGGAPGVCGVKKRTDETVPYELANNYNWGKRYSRWGVGAWTYADSSNLDRAVPAYYLGYAHSYRAWKRVFSRINQIYGNNSYNKFPFKRMEWLDAYSSNRSRATMPDTSDKPIYDKAFLKCVGTSRVSEWSRGSRGEYIDSLQSGHILADSLHRTYVEVGLFKDHPGDTLKGYGALVVNTRLYPSLRDAEDTVYYNSGLGLIDHAASTLGDIDTRKAWFKIDTNNFDPAFRTTYYVVRDTWHQDTTYLVKCDSSFGIYLKPAESRMLYIEKGISIQAAKGAASTAAEFGYNNGRRVAERYKGTRDIIAYTRAGKLYVSNSSRGNTVPGYNERSDGDNIATGNEVIVDNSNNNARPSVCVGRNDSSIAIIYWSKISNQGRIRAAYQVAPDSGWYTTTYGTLEFKDTSSDHSLVTPVLTPYNDTSWVVAASYSGETGKNPGIVGLRFRFIPSTKTLSFYADSMAYLFQDQATDSVGSRSLFPTIASRPIADSLYPIRFAWQKNGQIGYRRMIWSSAAPSTPIMDAAKVISQGLPSYCQNVHPSIAMCGILDAWVGLSASGVSGGINIWNPPPFPTSNWFRILASTMNDYVAWESIISDTPRYVSHGLHYPVLRNYVQRLNNKTGKWNRTFQVFKPDTTSSDYRFPNVSANNRIGGKVFNNSPTKKTVAYHDFLRLVWQNPSTSRLNLAHWENGWLLGGLNERGLMPSQGQTTDSLNHWTDSNTVPRSLVFIGQQQLSSNYHVRVTNGWAPWIDVIAPSTPKLVFLIDSNDRHPCFIPFRIRGSVGDVTLISASHDDGVYKWSQIDPSDGSILGEDWAVTPESSTEIHTEPFVINAGDSLLVNRVYDYAQLSTIQHSLLPTGDTVKVLYILRRYADSTFVGCVEHAFITPDSIYMPGYGLDNNYTRYRYPLAASTDSVYISLEIKRSQIDSLTNVVLEYEESDDLSLDSYKRSHGNSPSRSGTEVDDPIIVQIVPNPLSYSASVTITLPSEAMTTVELYNLAGAKLQTLYSNAASGDLKLTLDGQNLSSGSYLLRVQSGDKVVTRKISLVK